MVQDIAQAKKISKMENWCVSVQIDLRRMTEGTSKLQRVVARLKGRKTGELQSSWPWPSLVKIYHHREGKSLFHCNCSHLPMYFEIFFKKCILDMCCTTSFTNSSSTDLKSCVRQVEVQYVQHPFPCHLTRHLPYTALQSNSNKPHEDKISRDLHIVWSIRSLLSSRNSWNNLWLSTSATDYSLAYIRIFQIQTRSKPPDPDIKKKFLNREVANLASCTHEKK